MRISTPGTSGCLGDRLSIFVEALCAGDTTVDTSTPSSYTSYRGGYTAIQRRALDAIGNALKHRRINFYIATELRDLVRSGQVEEVEELLRRYRQDSERLRPFRLFK